MVQDGNCGCIYKPLPVCGEQTSEHMVSVTESVRTEETTLSYQKQQRSMELSLVAWDVRKGFLDKGVLRVILRDVWAETWMTRYC